MKIGIVTYVKCDNYGAELQAYALQWKLNKLGYDFKTCDKCPEAQGYSPKE